MISDAGLGPWPIPTESWAFSIPMFPLQAQESRVETRVDVAVWVFRASPMKYSILEPFDCTRPIPDPMFQTEQHPTAYSADDTWSWPSWPASSLCLLRFGSVILE